MDDPRINNKNSPSHHNLSKLLTKKFWSDLIALAILFATIAFIVGEMLYGLVHAAGGLFALVKYLIIAFFGLALFAYYVSWGMRGSSYTDPFSWLFESRDLRARVVRWAYILWLVWVALKHGVSDDVLI